MMNKLVYLLFGSVMLSGYLSLYVNKYLGLVPELISGTILLFVILKIGIDQSISIRRPYLILAGIAALHLLAGLVINLVPPGVILNGLRPHLKWIPIFLLPIVYRFSDEQIARQLKFLLFLALAQCPIALYQRLVEFRTEGSGDVVTGTMGFGGSGSLSVFLMAATAVLVSFYMARRIRTVTFLTLMVVLFLPTTINETKVTLIMLPVALFVPFLYGGERRLSAPRLAGFGALLLILFAGYGSIYDFFVKQDRYGVEIGKFLSNDKDAKEYLYSGADLSKEALKKDRVGNVKYPKKTYLIGEGGRRLDNIMLPLLSLSDDPVRLWVGVGVGNVSTSFRKEFSGEFSQRLGMISAESLLSFQLWEMGIGGAALFLVLVYLLIRDSHQVARNATAASTLARGWTGVLIIVLLAIPYVDILQFNALIYLFAYFSGYIAAERYRLILPSA